ncbi:MAG: hypothetical protein KKG33_04695 [candidate division Zixibacteria bacterium]|nr:hypothetical protein [candidate division Zixibacteria bacterium]MBU1471822.1 hypothetical protein [candidate division Zixibacteria bacterium]MBU2624840.1 hypothetical protein [candidate division Zixibacteria bacterium]
MKKNTKLNRLCEVAALCMLLLFSSFGIVHAGVIYKMYATHPFDTEGGKSPVSVYDFGAKRLISTLQTVPGATLARVTPDGKEVWFFSPVDKSAGVFSVSTDAPVGKAYLDAPACDAVFDPDSAICYVACGSNEGDGGLNVVKFIDTDRRVAAYTMGVGKNPVAIAIRDDGSRLYVANKDDNSISVIDPRKYALLRTMYAGVSPHDLVLTADNRYLFVANRGVDAGAKGGSCITILDAESGKVMYVVETGNGPTSIGLSPDGKRMVVSHPGSSNRENLWFYDINYQDSGISVATVAKATAGNGIEFGTVDPTGKHFVVPDQIDGGVLDVDMVQPGSVSMLTGFPTERSFTTAFASVDYDRQIAARDSVIARDPASPEAVKAYFEKASLHNTAGNRNEVVATLNDVIASYPGSAAEMKALFSLGSLCYDGLLFANAADYYNRGLIAYGELLAVGDPGEKPVSSDVLTEASERLGDLSLKLDTDYFVNLYKLYGNIPVKHPEFPGLFFTFGVALQKKGNTKYAMKCFEETENRLIELMDDQLYQEMKIKLALVRRTSDVVLRATKIKDAVVLDGELGEWSKSEGILLDRRDNVIVNQLRWFDPSDLSGEFHVGYDQFNLYVAGRVVDDRIFRPDRGAGDYLTIYLDVREGSGNYLTRSKAIGEGVISIRIVPPSKAGGQFLLKSDAGVEPLIGGKSSVGGYNFELKIPLAYLKGFSPGKGQSIGLGIELFDIDSAAENDPPKIMGWLMPTKSSHGTRFSEMFGILEF